jgi:hypothetical protein
LSAFEAFFASLRQHEQRLETCKKASLRQHEQRRETCAARRLSDDWLMLQHDGIGTLPVPCWRRRPLAQPLRYCLLLQRERGRERERNRGKGERERGTEAISQVLLTSAKVQMLSGTAC